MRTAHLALVTIIPSLLYGAGDAAKRLDDAADVLTEIMSAPDKGIPRDLLQKAECLVIIPGLKKGAFITAYDKGVAKRKLAELECAA